MEIPFTLIVTDLPAKAAATKHTTDDEDTKVVSEATTLKSAKTIRHLLDEGSKMAAEAETVTLVASKRAYGGLRVTVMFDNDGKGGAADTVGAGAMKDGVAEIAEVDESAEDDDSEAAEVCGAEIDAAGAEKVVDDVDDDAGVADAVVDGTVDDAAGAEEVADDTVDDAGAADAVVDGTDESEDGSTTTLNKVKCEVDTVACVAVTLTTWQPSCFQTRAIGSQ